MHVSQHGGGKGGCRDSSGGPRAGGVLLPSQGPGTEICAHSFVLLGMISMTYLYQRCFFKKSSCPLPAAVGSGVQLGRSEVTGRG